MHNSKIHGKFQLEKEKDFICTLCNGGFTSEKYLQTHLDIVHDGKKPFLCEFCEYSFDASFKLKRHITKFHDMTKQYQCESCHISFDTERKLKRHVIEIHIQIQNPSKKSEESSLSKRLTSQKKDIETSIAKNVNVCNYCSNVFKSESALKVNFKICQYFC